MNKERIKEHRFVKGETVLHQGKPVRVLSATAKCVTVQLGPNHYKAVMPVELELIDGGGVEVR